MDRMKLIMLALMNDGMEHHKDAIIDSVSKINLDSLCEIEFNELWKNMNGHGGKSIDGHCSVCLDFLSTIKAEIPV